ncbi:MAG: sodium-dependent transporter [Deltaproteobacteria bacterium]|nr:sodium-dependent transporter [Deltaproteobacteria bacterium]
MTAPTEQRFSSRWGLILSVLGIAVGTGNIWRFPRIAAQNGGDEGAGAFLVAWLVFLLVWSLPLIIAEYALGRAARSGVVGTFVHHGGRGRAWMGAFVGLTATAIMFYYSVVAGWCIHYVGATIWQAPPTSTAAATQLWEGFQSSGQPVLFHALAMIFGVIAVRRGVQSIERINRILVPTLLGIVVLSLLRAVTLDGAGAGLQYLLTPQWSQLAEPKVWLEALTQNAWDTGAGWGLILTYAAYMSHRGSVVKNAIITGVANNTVSLLAAFTIFGTVFSVLGSQMSHTEILGVMKDSGPASTGLTFIWMPQLFAKMPLGRPVALLFFVGLAFAALSSLISMIELVVRTLVDLGMARGRALGVVFGVGFALGIPSAMSLDFLSNQDFVWGVALMISGLFVALVTARAGTDVIRQTLADNPNDWDPGRAWSLAIRVVVPTLAVVLLGWWLYLSATTYAPETWWDPTDPFSVMSCVVQWGVAIAVLLLANRWLADRLR